VETTHRWRRWHDASFREHHGDYGADDQNINAPLLLTAVGNNSVAVSADADFKLSDTASRSQWRNDRHPIDSPAALTGGPFDNAV